MSFQSSRGEFPKTRMRRLRQTSWSRRLVSEHQLSVSDLIWPVFVHDKPSCEPIEALPGVERLSLKAAVDGARQAVEWGIPVIAIFPATNPELKTDDAAEAFNPDNLVCRITKAIKDSVGDDIGVLCDVALDPYSSHGHDGLLRDGVILNDETVEVLTKQAVVQASAGCDIIAPSDMMDGRIGAIRQALDHGGYESVSIMSYAAKYASGFYGPFREAVGSKGNLAGGSKATYQQSPSQTDEALHEVELDLREGADMVMVKPGMPYLDVLRRVRDQFAVPTFAYQVSGEYAMLHAAAQKGWLDLDKVMMESLLAFKRAGADGILTYFAIDAARRIAGET